MAMQLMVDIETLGTRADSVVLSIGLVKFNIDELGAIDIIDKKELILPSKAQIEVLKRHVQVSTIKWWMDRSTRVQAIFEHVVEKDTERQVSDYGKLINALTEFHKIIHDDEIDFIWYKGFDMGVLTHLMSSCEMDLSRYNFRKEMDFRTIENLVKNNQYYQKAKKEVTITHNAVEDCLAQIKLLAAAFYILSKRI